MSIKNRTSACWVSADNFHILWLYHVSMLLEGLQFPCMFHMYFLMGAGVFMNIFNIYKSFIAIMTLTVKIKFEAQTLRFDGNLHVTLFGQCAKRSTFLFKKE